MAHDKTGIRWAWVIAAGVLTEVCVVILMAVVITAHKFVARGATEAEQRAFVEQAGSLIAPVGGALLAFLFALWVCRRLKADFILNGLLVGVVGALLHTALFVASKVGYQAIYALADALKILGGLIGGYVAQKRFEQSSQKASAGVRDVS